MPNTLQEFLAEATVKAKDNLLAAYLRLPEDKRNWKAAETSRSAIDMVAEVAILSGYTADLIKTRQWAINDFGAYINYKIEVCGWEIEKVKALLDENSALLVEAITSTPDADLNIPIQMPWSTQSLAEVCAYPYWNASYHEGQINFIASMLGCLE